MGRNLAVLHVFSLVLLIFGCTMLIPEVVARWGGDGAQSAYDEGVAITIGAAVVLWVATRRFRRELQPRDGFLIVVLAWTGLPAFATIPLLVYLPALSFTDAYFETMSGLTATGGTVLSGLEHLPYSVNLWRTLLHWLGGMGIIVLAVAILPLLGIGGRQLFRAEMASPMKETRLTPRVAETAKGLWLVYVTFTLGCVLALRWAGMGWGDAVVHAFSVMSLGGFSSYDASLGHFDSLAVEVVVICFGLLAGISFSTHFLAFRLLSASPYARDIEVRFYLLVLGGSALGIGAYLVATGAYADFGEALRDSTFHTVSIATSLGLVTTDYSVWPFFAQIWILFLGSFAACSGSAGGGIKMMRAIILYKQVFHEIVRAMHPNAIRPIKLGSEPVASNVLFAVLAFGFMYMLALVSLTLVMAFSGLDSITAFSAVVACINNTGPGLSQVGPAGNFAGLGDFQKWVCIFAMLLGRLEMFTLLVVLTPVFWRK